MPAPSVVTSRIDVELPEWLVVPGPEDVTPAWRTEVETLFTVVAEVDRGEHGATDTDTDTDLDADIATTAGDGTESQPVGQSTDPTLFSGARHVDVVATTDDLLAFAAALEPGQRLVAGLGVPNRWPLPVVVSVGVVDADTPDLLTLAGVTGGLPTDPPEVDELPEHLGGEGPVVTRYDIDDDGAIWASVCAVRRLDGVDTRVLWRTRELEVVPVFAPAVVGLVGRVVNEAAA
jgi:hypothetical protein